MDAVSDPKVHTVVAMTSAQVGKTEALNNVCGFYIDQDPSPILVLQPTLDMGQAWSKDRLAPMLRDTPALHGKVRDAKSRDSGNTLMHKTFPGGHITIAGANSAASLASRPIRVLLADEVDRYPVSAGTEGDPILLAGKRTTTFWNRKRILTSTPTVKNARDEKGKLTGGSRIEQAYDESDQRKFYVPCPDCGHHQRLIWSQVRWHRDQDEEGKTLKHYPETAEYSCEECGSLWSDAQRRRAVSQGEWRAHAPFNGVAGFHLSELYSPWVRLSETVQAFLDAQGNTERLRAWTNTSLGETWEESGERLDASSVLELAEMYGPDDLPDSVLYATAGVDTQDDRLEVEVVGWGQGERSWGIRYEVIYGDPAQDTVWQALDDLLLDPMLTESGRPVRIAAAAVDSGGHHAEAVHRFCRERFRRRVYAIKGKGGQGEPIWPRRASKAKTNDHVFMVGVDTAKDSVYARWAIPSDKDGACTVPADPALGYDETWAAQVASEQRMTRYREGRPYTVWVLPGGKRNEALDCRVYAMAAMRSLPNRARAKIEADLPASENTPDPKPQPVMREKRQRGSSYLGTR